MHCFRDNEVPLPTGYDVIVISFLRAFQVIFYDVFRKSDHDFLTAFLSNVLSEMHGFRDNEVYLPTGYDVNVISPLGGVPHRFCWRNLKERPSFIIMGHWHISRISYRIEVIRLFILAGNCPFPTHFRGSFAEKHPKFHSYILLIPQRVFLTPDCVFWAIVRENWFTGMGCSSVEE